MILMHAHKEQHIPWLSSSTTQPTWTIVYIKLLVCVEDKRLATVPLLVAGGVAGATLSVVNARVGSADCVEVAVWEGREYEGECVGIAVSLCVTDGDDVGEETCDEDRDAGSLCIFDGDEDGVKA